MKWFWSGSEWMSRLFPKKMLKSEMAKQNAITETGRTNMAEMIAGYFDLEKAAAQLDELYNMKDKYDLF